MEAAQAGEDPAVVQAVTVLMRRKFLRQVVNLWEAQDRSPIHLLSSAHQKPGSRVTRRFMQKIQSYALGQLWKLHPGMEFTPKLARQKSLKQANIWEVILYSRKTDLDESRKFQVDVDVERWVAGESGSFDPSF
jgi:hypothetical protein